MQVTFPTAYKELFRPHRYKVYYGGRGCVDEDTEISTPSGKIKIKDFSGGLLYAYDGEKIIVTFGSKPKKYDAEKLYKVSTASYNITVTANHRFLTNRGWLKTCDLQIGQDCLATSSAPSHAFQEWFSPLVTNSDTYLQEWLKDALGCLQKVEGWICHYWLDYHRCGAPPQTVSGIALGVLPLQDGEQLHMSHTLSRKDVQERAYINALFCHVLSLSESWGVHRDEVGKNSAYQESYICDKFSELFSELHRVFQQFHGCNNPVSITRKFSELVRAFYTHASQDESFQRAFESLGFSFDDSSCSYSLHGCNLPPHIITQEKVESIEYVGEKYFYDIQVPIYHNYIGNNIVNHNSGKSWSFARALLLLGYDRKLRILCAREIQRSISDSVHKLLTEQIDMLGLAYFYAITRDSIKGANGTEFIFKGLHANSQEIKSTEGVDICWIEEAMSVSEDSWAVLIPTIRKEGSEIWVTFNPDSEKDPVYQRFLINGASDAYIRKINYDENPHFPDVLRKEMEWLKSRDYQAYLHIWEGEVKRHSNALVFGNYFKVEEFDTPARVRFYHGADWGFACLGGDTMVMTDRGEKRIKDIRPGDKVLTRKGYKSVVAFLPRGKKKVYSLDCGNGRPITVTGDHRIYTADGWKRVDELKAVENICMIQSNSTAGYTSDILTENTRTTSIASGRRTANIISESITGTYGNTTMEIFPKVATFITSMEIRLTTALKTLCALPKANTKRYIIPHTWEAYPKKLCESIDGFMATIRETGQSVGLKRWKRRRNAEESAKSVESLTPLQTYIKNSVLRNAERKAMPEIHNENMCAKFADEFSSNRLTQNIRLAQTNAPINLQSLSEWQDVYDLSIEGEHEFFANGVLVHNCDPTTLIRCFIDGKRLYIDREAWGIGVEIDNTPALFDTIETARKWPIKADCARPETISYMRRQGFKVSAAKKWAGSIEDGIEFLKTFEIVVHPRCKHTIDELNHYSYKIDKQTGDILPVIVDSWNHCLDALRYSMDGLIKGKTGDWSALIS